MTEPLKTDLIATIKDIHREAAERYGKSPKKVSINSLMRTRIVRQICDVNGWDFTATRREAAQGMKLLGMRFLLDNKVPDDEMYFCTKQSELMVRIKVDQQPSATPQVKSL